MNRIFVKVRENLSVHSLYSARLSIKYIVRDFKRCPSISQSASRKLQPQKSAPSDLSVLCASLGANCKLQPIWTVTSITITILILTPPPSKKTKDTDRYMGCCVEKETFIRKQLSPHRFVWELFRLHTFIAAIGIATIIQITYQFNAYTLPIDYAYFYSTTYIL